MRVTFVSLQKNGRNNSPCSVNASATPSALRPFLKSEKKPKEARSPLCSEIVCMIVVLSSSSSFADGI